MTNLSVILAMASDGAIGNAGDLLWHLSADLKRFKALTMGHPIIMGRKTWESLPKGALPGRRNIVVTRQPDYEAEGAEVYHSVEDALRTCPSGRTFVIGGAEIYRQTLPIAGRLELTVVDACYPEADTRIADPSKSGEWVTWEIGEWQRDEKSGLRFRFETYRRL